MDHPRIRPRFVIFSPVPPTQFITMLRERLDDGTCPCTGQVAGTHIHLRIRRSERRIWSPHLNVDVQADKQGCVLRGHFGPHPDVWTFFIAMYAILSFAGIVGLLFGLSQWMIESPPVALWILPGTLVLACMLYGFAIAGQRLGQDQMRLLRDIVKRTAA